MSTPLYDPARHEALDGIPWDAGCVRTAIADIVADAEAHIDPDGQWPPHPDDTDRPNDPPLTPLYFGTAGVRWALDYLAALGVAAPRPRPAYDVATEIARNRRWLATSDDIHYSSFFFGDLPIRLMACQYGLDGNAHKRLRELLGNERDPTLEIMWGRSGRMLAMLFLYELTADPFWADLFRDHETKLRAELHAGPPDDACNIRGLTLWCQDLYGERSMQVGAMHGFAGNVFVLLKGWLLLDPAIRAWWQERIVHTIIASARVAEGLANWPPAIGKPRAGRDAMVVQFCHGAPGLINSVAGLSDDRLDEILTQGGELIWRAGPLNKGANLCHGTTGNGYAFLKLYQRTGDPRWLERARAFAMHAVRQIEDARARFGRGRYSLWTGDAGAAIYLFDCLSGVPRIPTWDVFFAA